MEAGDRRTKDALVRAAIDKQLETSGEKARLQETLMNKLVEAGWKDDLRAYARDIVKAKGSDNVTQAELMAEIVNRGRGTVPDTVRNELLAQIRQFLSSA